MTRKLYDTKLSGLSKNLRNNATKEEKTLWYKFLRTLPITVKRQKIIGKYIVDFYCASAKLVIELDGTQHFENDGLEYDKARDEFLRSQGLTVVRYSNLDIKTNFDAVCEDIRLRLGNK